MDGIYITEINGKAYIEIRGLSELKTRLLFKEAYSQMFSNELEEAKLTSEFYISLRGNFENLLKENKDIKEENKFLKDRLIEIDNIMDKVINR